MVIKIKPDIIHTNVGVIHEGFHVAKELGIPHVWHLREYQTKDFKYFIYPTFDRFVSYLRETNVITITDDIKKHFGLTSLSTAHTIYNGIFFSNECIIQKSKENYFLMASRISPEKGHADAIKAFSNGYFKLND